MDRTTRHGKQGFRSNSVSRWLKNTKYENSVVYLDGWSIVHAITGFLVGMLFSSLGLHWYLAFVLFVGYEFLEKLTTPMLFSEETFKDKFWDVLVGYTFYFLGSV